MKVGVLGSGDVGRVLAGGFLTHGHEVMLGSRAPAKLADWVKPNPKARTGSFADAAKFGDVVVLAVKGGAAPAACAAGRAICQKSSSMRPTPSRTRRPPTA